MKWTVSEKSKKYIAGALTVLSVFFFLKYVLVFVMPFFIALCIVGGMYPVLHRLGKRFHISKEILAGCFFLIAVGMISILLWILAALLCNQISFIICHMGMYEDCFCRFVKNTCQGMEKHMGIQADYMEKLILTHVYNMTERIRLQALPNFMTHSVIYAKTIFSAVAFLAITLIATVLLAKDYQKIRNCMKQYELYRIAEEIASEIGTAAGGYFKAQSIILCTISLFCAAGLWMAGIEYGAAWGVFAGILDSLPFIGTGIVLVPIGIWQLIQGKIWKSAGILFLYILCIVTREVLEPKLIGKKMGIFPIAILLAIYIGVKIYGVSGVFLGPFSFLLIKEICRKLPYFQQND